MSTSPPPTSADVGIAAFADLAVASAFPSAPPSPSGPDPPAVALYYCYVEVASVPSLVSFHDRFAPSLGGRVRVSAEGINGVLSGRTSGLRSYEAALRAYLSDEGGGGGWELDVKYCRMRRDLPASDQMFETLSVNAVDEVVSTGWWGEGRRAPRKKKNRRRKKDRGSQHPGGDGGPAADPPAAPPAGTARPDPAPHLSPREWHAALLAASSPAGPPAVLLDVRNVYESRIGHFRLPGVPTVATNTRSYRSFPALLDGGAGPKEGGGDVDGADGGPAKLRDIVEGKDVFMYCTGGVRCERASQKIMDWAAKTSKDGGGAPRRVFQLKGGIQRYLDLYGGPLPGPDPAGTAPASVERGAYDNSPPDGARPASLFRGKNFVFDPRRTDPTGGPGAGVVGRCRVCSVPHDDYDNGSAPAEGREARCVRCRILVLVCDGCRRARRCGGEEPGDGKADLFCGPGGRECVDDGNSGFVEVL